MGFYAVAGWQPLSDTGAILAGGTLTFTKTGTSTAKNVYSNKALSAALTNPVELDANGRTTTNLFLLEDEGYRVVLKNSSGTTIWTRDEQFGLALAVDERTRRKAIVRSPMDHGAVGDGSSNDATALAAALTQLSTDGGGVLDLEGNTYRCDSTLSLISNLTIRNGTIDFSNAAISAGLQGAGSVEASPRTFVGVSGNNLTTVSSVSGIAAGDLVRIRSSDTIDGSHKYAELFLVESTSGSDTILVDGRPLGTYSTSPFVEEITPIQDVRLENLTIKAPSSAGYSVYLDLCQRVRLANVRVIGTGGDDGIRVTNCRDVVLSSCVLSKLSTDEGPGIHIGDASRNVVVAQCRIEGAVLGVEVGENYGTHHGLTRDVRISDCDIDWCGGVVFHEGAAQCVIEDCTLNLDTAPAVTTTAGILVGGADIVVRNNSIRWAQGTNREAIDIAMQTCNSVTVSGNKILGDINATGTAIRLTSGTIDSVRIVGNEIHETGGKYIDIVDCTVVYCEISGNTLRGGLGTDEAVDVTPATGTIATLVVDRNFIDCDDNYTTGVVQSDSSCTDVFIRDNIIKCTAAGTQTGISIPTQVPTYLVIDGNHITGPGAGISVVSATSTLTRISRNTVVLSTNAAATACIVCNHSNANISGNTCISTAGVGKGIDVNGGTLTNISIIGNTIRTDDTGIEVSGSLTGIVIANNNVTVTSATSTVYVCAVDPADAGATSFVSISGNFFQRSADDGVNTFLRDIDGVTVSGNVIVNGTYGLDIDAGSTEAIHDGNVFSGQATGDTNGTFDTAGDSA